MDKQTKQLVKELEKQGFIVTLTKKSHLKVTRPGYSQTVILAGTPSDSRSFQNGIAHLRRDLGYIDPKRGHQR
ncbi:hypothetical protein [Dermacoccus sp. Tok2021]|uniref:hypothetical protein n=1 Tax=Dermacoccus sp. Tok2021 TaxID=2826873 RepID=UPI001CA79565|nr:hypothetical protein [Dermacoccus sp. Tok2021]MBZ4499004.1 hypothetical protein [Dermacoccus sp. Tok2021]